MSTPPLFVLIEWEDSHTIEGWHHLDGPLDDTPVTCRSVGWLVLDGAKVKTVAPHMSVPSEGETPQACGIMRIPVRSIVRMVVLRRPAIDDSPEEA